MQKYEFLGIAAALICFAAGWYLLVAHFGHQATEPYDVTPPPARSAGP